MLATSQESIETKMSLQAAESKGKAMADQVIKIFLKNKKLAFVVRFSKKHVSMLFLAEWLFRKKLRENLMSITRIYIAFIP